MSKPKVTERIDGYNVIWEAEDRNIHVTHLRQHSSDGRVTGEITILDTKGNIIYPQSSVTFTADRTRDGLAKKLNDRDSREGRDWGDMINQLTLIVIKKAREGKPIEELWTNEDAPDLEFLLEPLIVKGVPNVIFGDEGSTKSATSLICYTCLTLPWVDNPLGFTAPNRSIKTLILDYELPSSIAHRNIKEIQVGMGLPHFPLFHRECKAPLFTEVEQIANLMAEQRTECIIIDSQARASGGELNKTEPANAFYEALDKLETTSLIIAQNSKDKESKKKTIYGNALYGYFARNIWEICRSESFNDSEVDVALFHRKSNLTKRYKEMSFRWSFNGHKTKIERQPVDVAEFLSKVSLKTAILGELKSGRLTVKDLADGMGGNQGSVKTTLNRLRQQGLVVKLDDTSWGLSTKARA